MSSESYSPTGRAKVENVQTKKQTNDTPFVPTGGALRPSAPHLYFRQTVSTRRVSERGHCHRFR